MFDKENLVEIKKGKTGTGLLIENDGFIKGDSDTIRQINEDIENNHKFVCPDNFVVSAVFQKFDIKNANGRVYPEAILKREVSKYIEECVNRGCAIGALDHPSCQLADTKILTETGWKDIADVKVGENILTLTQDKKIEIHPVLRKIEEPYKGKLIHIKGRMIDIKVTPNHKFPIFNRYQKWKGFYTAQEMLDQSIPDFSHSYLYKNGEWEGRDDEYFVLSSMVDDEKYSSFKKNIKEKYKDDVKIPMNLWAKFMGIFLSEGHCNYYHNCQGGRVTIYQKKIEVVNEIRALFDELPFEYKEHVNQKTGAYTFSIFDLRLAKYLNQFGNYYTKYVPFDLKQQKKETLRLFYDWFVLGDGRRRGVGKGKYYSDDVFSTSEQLALDLNEIQLKIGYNGVFHMEMRDNDRYIDGRLIKGENTHPLYLTFRSLTKNVALQPKSLRITEEDYDGMVYCVEVENHNFYTMCSDGHCIWSGNSSTLSGHDVTHNILSLEWQGNTLIGEMKLHLSPGYKKYGVCSTSGDLVANMLLDNILIGVSSRALGSVNERMGVLYVEDDLELIGWDVVMTPSTPGAYIKSERGQLQQFIESKQTNRQTNSLLEGKLDEIDKLLF